MIQTGPLPRLTKLSGITFERLMELDRGEAPTLDEIEALAQAWGAEVAVVIRSLPNAFHPHQVATAVFTENATEKVKNLKNETFF